MKTASPKRHRIVTAMTPEELSDLHPRLYHVTAPDAWPMIKQHGLLSTATVLDLLEVDEPLRSQIAQRCRPEPVPLPHPNHGQIVINDNKPMSEKALAKCLDDGLTPQEWLTILNNRVFFWSTQAGLNRLLGARMNQGRKRLVLTLDTLKLARAYADRIEICPINSGSTIRKPARRGLRTFAPLLAQPYREWQKQRGQRDKILEVTVLGQIPDVDAYIIDRTIR
ncbi:MAG: hypothetical protein AAF607_15055 [Pseudomonadota bacterium]